MREAAMVSDEVAAGSRLMVFTDLDGCLLDHRSYDYRPALPALERLRRLAVPVVLSSSKTLAEIEDLRRRLALEAPVIAENGGVIGWPSDGDRIDPELLSPTYEHIRRELLELRAVRGYAFEGFGDWDDEQVARATGLPLREAGLARQRQCSEPLLWRDDPSSLATFEADLAERGLRLLQGGRFVHVLGCADKAEAMRIVVARGTDRLGAKPIVLALGDSPNDVAMLRAADRAVVVSNPAGPGIPVDALSGAVRTRSVGPAGWREAVEAVLDELGGV
ncbi:MAG: HAD-IIB family hydrolase [Chromatiales bacterium]|jgi:mannosyl-3-phosphoglycerate phosphatase